MDTRRSLFRKAGNLVAALTVYQILPKSQLKVGEAAYGAVKTFSDLRVRCIGTVQPILAADLIKGTAFTGRVDEGGHTHTYTVTPEQIAMINAGQVVQLRSSLGSDGSGAHNVTIDPAQLLPNGGSIQVFQSENGQLIGIRLGKGNQPYLYVEGTEGLDPATVKLCIGLAASCQAEGSFNRMQLIQEITNRQVFGSINRISVQGETLVHVWATTQSGVQTKIVAKINP
jgi:hypothetical protein